VFAIYNVTKSKIFITNAGYNTTSVISNSHAKLEMGGHTDINLIAIQTLCYS